jgi:hypothetical protein
MNILSGESNGPTEKLGANAPCLAGIALLFDNQLLHGVCRICPTSQLTGEALEFSNRER